MNKALDAWLPLAQQAVFRQLVHAFSYPGQVAALPAHDHGALLQVVATLLDSGVTLADPDALIDATVRTLLEARCAAPEAAQFVVARGDLAPRFVPALGTLGSPEHGATLVLWVDRIGEGEALDLSGPGCNGTVTLKVSGLAPAWLSARASWNAGFPMGVDIVLVDACRVAALPRLTRIGHSASEGSH